MEEEVYKDHWQQGVYKCAQCGRRLFSSKDKFKAGTQWPSFRKAVLNALETKSDFSTGMKKVAVKCKKCKQHLGHLFEDGKTCGDDHPEAGMRYSLLSGALHFEVM